MYEHIHIQRERERESEREGERERERYIERERERESTREKATAGEQQGEREGEGEREREGGKRREILPLPQPKRTRASTRRCSALGSCWGPCYHVLSHTGGIHLWRTVQKSLKPVARTLPCPTSLSSWCSYAGRSPDPMLLDTGPNSTLLNDSWAKLV